MLSQSNISIWRKCAFVLFALFVSFSSTINQGLAQTPPATPAGDENKIVSILCNVQEQISGPIGKAIAILIVISLAIALFIGKVSWGMAIAVAVGMGVLFGAQGIVKLISGDTEAIC